MCIRDRNITMPVTNNATLLDELKDAKFNLYRGYILNTDVDMDGLLDGDVDIAEIVASEFQFCTGKMQRFTLKY